MYTFCGATKTSDFISVVFMVALTILQSNLDWWIEFIEKTEMDFYGDKKIFFEFFQGKSCIQFSQNFINSPSGPTSRNRKHSENNPSSLPEIRESRSTTCRFKCIVFTKDQEIFIKIFKFRDSMELLRTFSYIIIVCNQFSLQ